MKFSEVKSMKYIVKGLMIGTIAMKITMMPTIGYTHIVFFLLLLSATLLIEEVNRKWQVLMIIIEIILTLYTHYTLGFTYEVFTILLFDSIYLGLTAGILPALIIIIWNKDIGLITSDILMFAMSSIIAYILKISKEKELYYRSILDGERRIRYDLEMAQNALVQSNKEIEHLTELKERNRIARDLHDNIGHSIAGILIQLQAAIKILYKNNDKAENILNGCVTRLQTSLETVRDTVHNMYNARKVSLDTIKEIINQYTYCRIDAVYEGDFSQIPTNYFKALNFVLKEALTNVSKHSDASKIQVNLSNTGKLLRMQIKDNGKGYSRVSGGIGIRIMRERIEHVDGFFSIDGSEGTLIVCVIPLRTENGYENSDCG